MADSVAQQDRKEATFIEQDTLWAEPRRALAVRDQKIGFMRSHAPSAGKISSGVRQNGDPDQNSLVGEMGVLTPRNMIHERASCSFECPGCKKISRLDPWTTCHQPAPAESRPPQGCPRRTTLSATTTRHHQRFGKGCWTSLFLRIF